MQFNLPKNAKEVVNTITSDVVSRLPSFGSFLAVSYFKSLITGFGLRIYNVYTKIPIMVAQFFATTAQNEFLLEIGNQWGITRNLPTGASGNIVMTGDAGTIIPIGTLFNNSAGLVYESQAEQTITQSTVSIASMSRIGTTVTVNFASDIDLASGIIIDSITGASPSDFNASDVQITVTSKRQFTFTQAGTAGSASGTMVAQWTTALVNISSQTQGAETNMVAGSIVNLATPITNVDNEGYVDYDEISAGTDVESFSSYRTRLLYRIRNPVTLFNNPAIINIMRSVAGVTRAWVFNPDSTVNEFTPTSITRSGNIALVYYPDHLLYNGTFISVTDANQDEYNVTKAPILVIDSDYFCYIVANTATTPATGTITISSSYVELGQVKVSFVRDDDLTQIPSATEVNDVKEVLLESKPAFMADQDVIVFSPTPVSVDFTFSSISPNTAAMQTAIRTTLENFFKVYNAVNSDIRFSDINAVLSRVIDSGGNLLSYTLSSPSSNISIGLNEIGILGDINYT